jgi:hypothetical protein
VSCQVSSSVLIWSPQNCHCCICGASALHANGQHSKANGAPPIQEPSVELFERFQQAARGHIRLMTVAPGLPHSVELIEHATAGRSTRLDGA